MNRYIRAGLMVAAIAATFATPSLSASRLHAVTYAKLPGNQAAPSTGFRNLKLSDATLTSADDRTWTLTLGNCALSITDAGLPLNAEDASFKETFEDSFAGPLNVNHNVFDFSGRATASASGKISAQAPIACDASNIYWVAMMHQPEAPHHVIFMVLAVTSYQAQTGDLRAISMVADTFLKGDAKPAESLGAFTADLAKALGK